MKSWEKRIFIDRKKREVKTKKGMSVENEGISPVWPDALV